jgi:ubiquinone/menaquinone biosynthesis C-methylase UbiE
MTPPTPPALPRDEVRSIYDRFGVRQDDQSWYEDKALQCLLQHGGFAEANVVAEIGCGTGRFAEMLLRDRLNPTARYVGLDISRTMVSLARQRLRPWDKRAEIVLSTGDFAELPEADIVVATYVLDLMDDPDIASLLTSARRALRPGGRLCLAGLAKRRSGLNALWSVAYRFAPRLLGGCRPVDLAAHLPAREWRILHDEQVSSYGLASEALVATRKG